MKYCITCKITKPETDFPRIIKSQEERYTYCKSCSKVRRRALIEDEKQALTKLEYDLRTKFGLTLHHYTSLLDKQQGVCAACRKPEQRKRKKRLSVDHNHTTGKVRGLLCTACNTGLGLLKDDFDTLLNLAKYVQEYDGAY